MSKEKPELQEAKFTLRIETCQFTDLDLQSLIEKLTLIKKLNISKFYTVEDSRKKEG